MRPRSFLNSWVTVTGGSKPMLLPGYQEMHMQDALYRITEGKHAGIALELLVFKDLDAVYERSMSDRQLAQALTILPPLATTRRVVVECDNDSARATSVLLERGPLWGRDRSWGVHRSALACGPCDKEFLRAAREPSFVESQKVELSLHGALAFLSRSRLPFRQV